MAKLRLDKSQYYAHVLPPWGSAMYSQGGNLFDAYGRHVASINGAPPQPSAEHEIDTPAPVETPQPKRATVSRRKEPPGARTAKATAPRRGRKKAVEAADSAANAKQADAPSGVNLVAWARGEDETTPFGKVRDAIKARYHKVAPNEAEAARILVEEGLMPPDAIKVADVRDMKAPA